MNYGKILRCTISGILPVGNTHGEVLKHNIFMMKRTLNRKQMKNLLCVLAMWCLGLSVHEAIAQCGNNPIQSFEVARVDNTTDGADNGAIEVRVVGGEGPFIYTLMADFGGKGKETVSTSSPTVQTTYTFRNVATNTKISSNGYIVEVQSSNDSDTNYPVVLCRQRMISNIEIK